MSAISTLAFEIQQALRFHNLEVKRSHINEIVAALLGFKTLNSLKLSSYPIFIESIQEHLNIELFEKRCKELNLSLAVAPIIQKHISSFHFLYLTIEEVSKLVRDALEDDSRRDDVLERLKKTFAEFPQLSIYPYLIAQFYSDCDNNFEAQNKDMNYLYGRYLQGKAISPTWKSDLDGFIKEKARNDGYKKNYIKYLKIATDLGSFPAQLQLYEFERDGHYFDEDEIDGENSHFDIELELAKRGNENSLKDIFERIVISEENYNYSRTPIDVNNLSQETLVEAWKWQKFAHFLGFDLAKGDYQAHAIHENGDYYDDDVGGPMYVTESGRQDIILAKLSLEREKVVNIEVNRLIQFYQNLDEFTFTCYERDSSYMDWDDEDDFNWGDE